MTGTTATAYYGMKSITAAKSFIVQAHGVNGWWNKIVYNAWCCKPSLLDKVRYKGSWGNIITKNYQACLIFQVRPCRGYCYKTFLSVIYGLLYQARVFVRLDWKGLPMTNTLAYYENP